MYNSVIFVSSYCVHDKINPPFAPNLNDATKFMEKIKQSKRLPKYIQTDGGVFYPTAFKKVFGTLYKDLKVEHKINNVSVTKKHNVRIETVFSKIKDRVDDFRGLKSLWSAPILMQGIIIQHNFIESHTTTGQVPSELAELKMDIAIIIDIKMDDNTLNLSKGL